MTHLSVIKVPHLSKKLKAFQHERGDDHRDQRQVQRIGDDGKAIKRDADQVEDISDQEEDPGGQIFRSWIHSHFTDGGHGAAEIDKEVQVKGDKGVSRQEPEQDAADASSEAGQVEGVRPILAILESHEGDDQRAQHVDHGDDQSIEGGP